MTVKEAVNLILPKDPEPVKKQPRLRTPTLTQALLLPFYKVPSQEPGGKTPDWQQPHLAQLKYEIMVCSVAMVVCPFTAFFIVQS